MKQNISSGIGADRGAALESGVRCVLVAFLYLENVEPAWRRLPAVPIGRSGGLFKDRVGIETARVSRSSHVFDLLELTRFSGQNLV